VVLGTLTYSVIWQTSI